MTSSRLLILFKSKIPHLNLAKCIKSNNLIDFVIYWAQPTCNGLKYWSNKTLLKSPMKSSAFTKHLDKKES